MLLIITPEDICWNIQKVKLKFNHEAKRASLTRKPHDSFRPFVWLFARTWIRKNTDCFAV